MYQDRKPAGRADQHGPYEMRDIAGEVTVDADTPEIPVGIDGEASCCPRTTTIGWLEKTTITVVVRPTARVRCPPPCAEHTPVRSRSQRWICQVRGQTSVLLEHYGRFPL